MAQTTGTSDGVIIPEQRDVTLDTASGPKSPPGMTAGAIEEPCGVPEQLTFFGEELGR
ncbi:MAG: hypothetical protein ABSB99_10365 [Acidimicrobiales bacterium]|jgi:hypothetical protein